ncbi:hypothetical protein CMUS01_14759 [Colletotrichum musicola]|uniref:Uncharacterized protein n=1 Tax=Colletotrichum musicola TaxID=2175873 RepID=A0A8H6MQR7_9PEZI|nr:hypothetical protein CMUS01_14759 [Colletotrichum musicola]
MASNNTDAGFGANGRYYSGNSFNANSESSSPRMSSDLYRVRTLLFENPPPPPRISPAELHRPTLTVSPAHPYYETPPSPLAAQPSAPAQLYRPTPMVSPAQLHYETALHLETPPVARPSPPAPLSPLPPMPRTYNPMKAKPLESEREPDDFEAFKLPPCEFPDEPIGELSWDMRPRRERPPYCWNNPLSGFDALGIASDALGAPSSSSSSVSSVKGSFATAEPESAKTGEERGAAKTQAEAVRESFLAVKPMPEFALDRFLNSENETESKVNLVDFRAEPEPKGKGKEKAITPPDYPWTWKVPGPQVAPAAPSRGPDAEQKQPEADSGGKAEGSATPCERPEDNTEKKKLNIRWALLSQRRAAQKARDATAAKTLAAPAVDRPAPLVANGSSYAKKVEALSDLRTKKAEKRNMEKAKGMDDVKSNDDIKGKAKQNDLASRFGVAEIPPFRGKKDVESKGKAKEDLSLEQIDAELDVMDKRAPAVQEDKGKGKEEDKVPRRPTPSPVEQDFMIMRMLECNMFLKQAANLRHGINDSMDDETKKRISDEAKKWVDKASNHTIDYRDYMEEEKNKAQLKKSETERATLEETVKQQAVEKSKTREPGFDQSPAGSARLPNGPMIEGSCKDKKKDDMYRAMFEADAREERMRLERMRKESDEEEMERMVREMEEEDARRERELLESKRKSKGKGKEENRPFLASTPVSSAKDSKHQKDLKTEKRSVAAAAVAGPSGASAAASGPRSATASASTSTPTSASTSSQTTSSASASADAATNTEQKSRVADAVGKSSEMSECFEAMRNTQDRLMAQIVQLDDRMKKDTSDINARLAELELRKANTKDTLQVPENMGPGTFIPWDQWQSMTSLQRREFVQRWVPCPPGETPRPVTYQARPARAERSWASAKKETTSPAPPPSPALGYGRGSPAGPRGPEYSWGSAATSNSPANNAYAHYDSPGLPLSQNPRGYIMFGDHNPQVPPGYARWGAPHVPAASVPPSYPVPGQLPPRRFQYPDTPRPLPRPTNPVHPARSRGRGQSPATPPWMRPGNYQPTSHPRPVVRLPPPYVKPENASMGPDEDFRDASVDDLAAKLGKCTLTSSADTPQTTQAGSSAEKEDAAEKALTWRERIEREALEANTRMISQEAVKTKEKHRGDAPASKEAAAPVEKTDADEKSRPTEPSGALAEFIKRAIKCAESEKAMMEKMKTGAYGKESASSPVDDEPDVDESLAKHLRMANAENRLVKPEVEIKVEVEPEAEVKVKPESDECCEGCEDEYCEDCEDEEYEEEIEPKIEEAIEPFEEEIRRRLEVETPEVEASEVEEEIESDIVKVDMSCDSESSDSESEYLFV